MLGFKGFAIFGLWEFVGVDRFYTRVAFAGWAEGPHFELAAAHHER